MWSCLGLTRNLLIAMGKSLKNEHPYKGTFMSYIKRRSTCDYKLLRKRLETEERATMKNGMRRLRVTSRDRYNKQTLKFLGDIEFKAEDHTTELEIDLNDDVAIEADVIKFLPETKSKTKAQLNKRIKPTSRSPAAKRVKSGESEDPFASLSNAMVEAAKIKSGGQSG
jgi:hypothetical protein